MATPLFTPKEIRVSGSQSGEPASVVTNSRLRRVVKVRNTWRVDDEWWREEISRLYFELELESGLVTTVFHDLVSGRWYQQKV
jgi:hypothetical protein